MTCESRTPIELGYRWPAEWEPHAATWLAWPHNPQTWPGRLAEAVIEFVDFAHTLARYEPVHVLAGTGSSLRQAEASLGNHENITLWEIPTNDAWIRDFGPMFVTRLERPAIVDWRYNAWGNKYPPFDEDDAATGRIGERLGLPCFRSPIVLEGGSVDGNGQGALLTTRSCLLNRNRNGDMAAETLEGLLHDYLAAHQVVWLDGQIAGDDTDGHVDQLARFLSTHVVAVASESDPGDPNFAPLARLRRQLEPIEVAGCPLEVVPLPLPAPLYRQGQRLPASYCNFYIANGVVIVPQFGDAQDRRARDILREHFPRRETVGLACGELVGGLGGFHCLTQQQPAPGPAPRAPVG